MRRTLKLAIAATTLTAVAPAAAQAATVTVTGDAGNPVAVNPAAPPTIRNMDVQAVVTAGTGDGPRYRTQVIGPDNVPASTASPCLNPEFSTSWRNYADYRGNGTYRVVVQRYTAAGCSTPTGTTATFPYTIRAGVAIAQPQSWLLSRPRNSVVAGVHQFGFNLNPGASLYEVRYARGGVIGADGAISGPSQQGFVDRTTGTVPMRFDAPGRWVIVARARTDDYYTAWSPPVTVQVKDPFDLQFVSFPDPRGPSYKLRGTVRSSALTGRRVRVAIARGNRRGKFRRLGRAKVRANGTFALRFRVNRVGRYRLRYKFGGSDLVARGTVVERIRIRRRVL